MITKGEARVRTSSTIIRLSWVRKVTSIDSPSQSTDSIRSSISSKINTGDFDKRCTSALKGVLVIVAAS